MTAAGATGEFELIDAIVAELGIASSGPHVICGPGDDAAMLTVPAGEALVTSVDTLVPDLHFPAAADAQLIGQRALRVSVSDLAAMGAEPLGCVISLVLPKTTDSRWVRELSKGFAAAATELGCPVTGGNLTAGPLSICVTVQGSVPVEHALLRGGAQPGDDVWVSGALGGAAVALIDGGLDAVSHSPAGSTVTTAMTAAQKQYFLPQPQLALGVALRGIANAAIDISDGLAADLAHIAQRSCVSVALDSVAIPRLAGATLEQALYGGDDYHLCFTAPTTLRSRVSDLPASVCRIGRVTAKPSFSGEGSEKPELLLDGNPLLRGGFDHFSNKDDL